LEKETNASTIQHQVFFRRSFLWIKQL